MLKELVYGIQASKDVKLSNISRALQEPIRLIKTEDRLSRNLAEEDLSAHINEQIMRLADDKITDDMVLAIDPGDIMKPYAKAMEGLCDIYDGSQGETAQGYLLCQVTAANLAHNKLVPLYCEAFSSKEAGYINSTERIKTIISDVAGKIGTKGTWAMDRGGDSIDIFNHFQSERLSFVTRLKLSRYLHFGRNTARQVQADHIDRFTKMPYTTDIVKLDDGRMKYLKLQYGAIEVALPEDPDRWYTLVIVKGFGQEPMLLLTNKQINVFKQKELWNIIEIYLTRWKCEECYRYIKQSYNLEDLRVRSYNSIRNVTAIVHAIAYFSSVYMGLSLKLKLMVKKIFIASKRFFGIPVFYDYAMADGIYELLKKTKNGIVNFMGRTGKTFDDFQLSLFPD